MNKFRLAFNSISLLVLLCIYCAPAHAQALRTWVSGVGDDANPCSRLAPCKSFNGAIAKTSAGGEIDALDPSGFGPVTITKSITIDGTGTFAGILATGANGIIVNITNPSDPGRVRIRGLAINGVGTGTDGIRFVSGNALHVEDCAIENFTGQGIDFSPANGGFLFVTNTSVRHAAISGIHISSSVRTAAASLERVRLEKNGDGLFAGGNSQVTIRDSVSAGNTLRGFTGSATLAASAELNIEGCVAANNDKGVVAGVGPSGGSATVRVSNTSITGNSVGLTALTGNSLLTRKNNTVQGNEANGSFTGTFGVD